MHSSSTGLPRTKVSTRVLGIETTVFYQSFVTLTLMKRPQTNKDDQEDSLTSPLGGALGVSRQECTSKGLKCTLHLVLDTWVVSWKSRSFPSEG